MKTKHITDEQKKSLARALQYILESEETHYEETVEEYGPDSEQAMGHAYNLARTLWVELDMEEV